MARGGNREGAGRRFKWQSGETRTIRVPIAIADMVLEIAQGLDKGTLTFDKGILKQNSQSKVVRFTQELKVYQQDGQDIIKLSDLARFMQALAKSAK
ncbi:MAG: hypothetical protein KME29_15310 [Calothrix sp. FI2-JRJ7]|jgi:hypothetical protein|nr:hypothetical protein [Calothrix sp. FI2-JRJ7]